MPVRLPVCDGSALATASSEKTHTRLLAGAGASAVAVLLAGGSSRAMLASARLSCKYTDRSKTYTKRINLFV